jgi:capsule polysaccharide export protein KpsE/RkpR
MTTQLELLQEQLKISEARSGPDNPFVKGLKAQIASLTKPRAENPVAGVERYSAGMRGAPSSTSTETEEDGIRAEAQRRLKVRQLLKAQPGQIPGLPRFQ